MSLRPYTTRGTVAVFYLNICISLLICLIVIKYLMQTECLVRIYFCLFSCKKDIDFILCKRNNMHVYKRKVCTKLKIVFSKCMHVKK